MLIPAAALSRAQPTWVVEPTPADPYCSFASVLLHIGDELLKVARREVLASDQHHRLLGEQCDRCEIGSGVVGKLLIERRVIGLSADAAEQEHMTVRCGLCDAIGADNARRPTDVFDNYLLAQDFAQPLRKTRPMTSNPPPAANGTTMVTGRVGHSCAPAGAFMAARAARTATILIRDMGHSKKCPRR